MLVGTLLALLHQSLFIGKRVLLTLANILSGANRDPEELIMVATSQIPAFTQDFMSPHYSYRTFGPLGRLAINFNVPPPMFDFDWEVYTPLRVLLVYQIRTRLFPWARSSENFQQFSESIDTIY